MRFLVTGGAGFIGSHIVKLLIDKGHSVKVVDNLVSGKLERLENVKDRIEFFKVDIMDYEKLNEISEDVDGIFHEAALISLQESFEKPEEYHRINVLGTENIFRIAKEFGIKVVFASSSSVYGTVEKIPIGEDIQKNPTNPYAKTKLEDEFLAEKYSKMGVSIIGLRYFNVYGKGQSSAYAGVITKFFEQISKKLPPIIFGDGKQVRDFVSVIDVAKANLKAMESKETQGFFNIGTGKSISILELANLVIKASKLNYKPKFAAPLKGDVPKSEADVTMVKKILNWEFETKLEDWIHTVVPSFLKIGYAN